jgi:hypothetical protein
MNTKIIFLILGLVFLIQEIKAQTNCDASTAVTELDINNVRAGIFPGADMWWDLVSAPKYEVPKGSGINRLLAGSLWLGGIDGSGQIMTAAQMFRQTPGNNNATDFFTGPGDSCAAPYCMQYDRIWKINRQEVIDFIGGLPATSDMQQFPGNYSNGNTLAPFVDVNNDGIYNILDGDYPAFDIAGTIPDSSDQLYGDQSLWFVFNDVCNIKTQTGSSPLGLEIQGQAFAFISPDPAINNTTFYRYKIINNSSIVLNDFYLGFWAGTPVPADFRRGSHIGNNMAFVLDDYPFDPSSGFYPSATGIQLLEGPLADPGDGIDNDRDSIMDENDERCGISSYIVFENANGLPMGNPATPTEYYNYMKGINTSLCPCTNQPTPFMYPGTSNPDCPCNWEDNAPAGDYFFLLSSGKFTLSPGDIQTITYAVTWAVDSSAGNSLNTLFAAHDTIQSFFRNGYTLPVGINDMQHEIKTSVYPNPFSDHTNIYFDNPSGKTFSMIIYDVYGRELKVMNDLSHQPVILEKGNMKPGLYFYKIYNHSMNEVSGKIIIR